MSLRVALVVPGRFHAFDLGKALLARGNDVTIFTNYPARSVARFGFPADRVRSFIPHAVLARVYARLPTWCRPRGAEEWLHRLFGAWIARELSREFWDVIHTWSGVSEEILRSHGGHWGITLLMRGSCHVVEQNRLLADEEHRADVAIDRPTPWMMAREQREYELADHVLVLSSFAARTFEEQGFPRHHLSVVPLGVSTKAFRPSAAVVAERRRRILAGEPLRILYVGLVTYRKGLLDLAAVIRALAGPRFTFRLVGAVMPEAERVVADLRGKADFLGKVPQHALPALYNEADIFVFPTIEDGFAAVLAQAKAAGLPIIATTNCAAPDLVKNGRDGWIVPIRRPEAIVDHLRHAEANREVLAHMTQAVYDDYRPHDWAEVAIDFESLYHRLVGIHEPVRRHG